MKNKLVLEFESEELKQEYLSYLADCGGDQAFTVVEGDLVWDGNEYIDNRVAFDTYFDFISDDLIKISKDTEPQPVFK